jgi:hypothetical protein
MSTKQKMKRRLLLMIGLLVLIAAGSFTLASVLMTDSINRDTCATIQKGMTEAEVIKILRKPCDDSQGRVKIWNGKAGRIGVLFEKRGTVETTQFQVNPEMAWPKIRRWLQIRSPTREFQAPTSGDEIMILPDL